MSFVLSHKANANKANAIYYTGPKLYDIVESDYAKASKIICRIMTVNLI